MDEFIKYIQERLNELNIQLDALNDSKEKIANEVITLGKEERQTLTREYQERKTHYFFHRLLKPTTNKLIRLKKENLTNDIDAKINEIEEEVKELTILVNKFSQNEEPLPLESFKTTIKEALMYGEKNNVAGKELLEDIVRVLRIAKPKKESQAKSQAIILSYFDLNNKLMKKQSYIMLVEELKKLLFMLLNNIELNRFNIIIESIFLEIESKEVKADKALLSKQKQAVEKLRKYYNAGEIIKTTTLENFSKLLDNAGIDGLAKDNMMEEMSEKILENQEISKETNLLHFLSENELAVVRKSKKIESNYSNPVRILIKRLRDDIISLCDYLEINKELNNEDGYEILSKRVSLLEELIDYLEKNLKEGRTFIYLKDNNNVPFLIRTLENLDFNKIPIIYKLLCSLANDRIKHSPYRTIGGLEVYKLTSNDDSILYTIKNGKIVIIDYYQTYDLEIYDALKPRECHYLKNLFQSPETSETIELDRACEKLIISSLTGDTKKLKYTKTNS